MPKPKAASQPGHPKAAAGPGRSNYIAVEDILKPGGRTTVRQSFLVEGGFDERNNVASAVEDFQPRQQVVVGKGEQSVPGDAFFIGGPVGSAEFVWKRGFVVVAQDFHPLFTIIEDFQEEHPAELSKSLSIAIDTSIFAHDILDGLDEVGEVGHGANRIDEQCGGSKSNFKLDWKFPVGAGLLGFPGGPSHFRAVASSPSPRIAPPDCGETWSG